MSQFQGNVTIPRECHNSKAMSQFQGNVTIPRKWSQFQGNVTLSVKVILSRRCQTLKGLSNRGERTILGLEDFKNRK